MVAKRAVGPGASARKYDLLTALGTHALASGKSRQVSCLRLITLITARYNWKSDELCVGRPEMARLWNVDERTVKRELARLRGYGWLEVKRPGARGRITSYWLCFDKLFEDTRPDWPRVGPDYEARMVFDTAGAPPESAQARVVQFPGASAAAPDVSDGSVWSLASALLHAEDAQIYGAWLRGLTQDSLEAGRLRLRAPSKFHAHYVHTHLLGRILAALKTVDGEVETVSVIF